MGFYRPSALELERIEQQLRVEIGRGYGEQELIRIAQRHGLDPSAAKDLLARIYGWRSGKMRSLAVANLVGGLAILLLAAPLTLYVFGLIGGSIVAVVGMV